MGILGLAVAIAAFYNSHQGEKARLSADQAQRKHDRLTVRPRLQLSNSSNDYPNGNPREVEIILSNNGLGPAEFKWMDV